MEEAVGGAVVGATIQVVLQNLLSFSVEEIGLIWNFNKDLQKMKDSFVMIRKFLEDAEARQVTDKAVTHWLMKLEAVAFDADYVFDQLNYEVLRKKVETDHKRKKKVSSFFSNSNPLAFRHRIARKIKEIKLELKSINGEARELGLQTRFSGAHACGAGAEEPAYSETDSLSMDRIFVGRENDAAKIVEMVSNTPTEEKVSVLPIVGMGGLGKTTLARKVFNDDTIISRFEKRIWVYVSTNFAPETVFKSILATLIGENVVGSREIVLKKLQEKIGDKRYLLVLDDVWSEDAEKWDNFITSLEAISPLKGNVIIVTTRKGSVASTVKTLDIHKLGVLSNEDCWCIIKAKAFGGEHIPSDFESTGKRIAIRCGGLPLAAKVVGSLLRCKSEDEWRSIENRWLSDFGGDDNIVSKILKLSFDNLSSPSLKKSFAYCSILPKGWSIKREHLIHLWMAEGFLQTDQEKDMEIAGNKVFNVLLQSSLLQVQERDHYGVGTRGYGMHDLVHDLASSILNSKFLDGTAHHVRYMSIPFIDESSPIPKERAKNLRGLFCSSKISNIMLSNLKCLHVLILNDGEMKELPIEIGKLISLRLLDISNTKIECLPDSIGDLYHLQTLRATTKKYGYLRKLPDTFKFLTSLRHLYIPNIELPPEIGKLSYLQTLYYFQVGDKEGCGIMELGSLNNLKGEIEIHNLEKVRDKEEAKKADLFHKSNIVKLKLVWNESREDNQSNDENVLEGLQPHPNLNSLKIEGFEGRSFPLWTLRMDFDNLLEIRLWNCRECEEIPMMGHLPRLKSLYLSYFSNVRSIGSLSFYGIKEDEDNKNAIRVFPALEKLVLNFMENLTSWTEVDLSSSSRTQPHEVLVFHRLEYLKISNCRQLKIAPRHFPCLKELEIDEMESGVPLASICGSKLTTLTKLIISKVDGVVCLPHGLFNNNRGLLELDISHCSNLTHLVPCLGGGGASLRKIVIDSCSNFENLPEDVDKLNALEELRIKSCPNLKSIAYPSGSQLSSQGFTSLRHLEFTLCSGLTMLPCEMIESCALSLETLVLRDSESLTNLPQVMSILHKMSHLRKLGIKGVPKLHDVAVETGSLRSINKLEIGGSSDCGDYVFFDRIFPAFQSLRELRLFGMEEWDALPDQLQHLTTLHELLLHNFGIQVLPEWIGRLSSLGVLLLWNCKKLRHLPSKKAMHALTKLSFLSINNCPLILKQELEEEGNDDSEWSKVSHIPYIYDDDRRLSVDAL